MPPKNPPHCCRCDTASCATKNCNCKKAGTPCSNCKPKKDGKCQNGGNSEALASSPVQVAVQVVVALPPSTPPSTPPQPVAVPPYILALEEKYTVLVAVLKREREEHREIVEENLQLSGRVTTLEGLLAAMENRLAVLEGPLRSSQLVTSMATFTLGGTPTHHVN